MTIFLFGNDIWGSVYHYYTDKIYAIHFQTLKKLLEFLKPFPCTPGLGIPHV